MSRRGAVHRWGPRGGGVWAGGRPEVADDCLVVWRGAEERRQNGSGTSAPRRLGTRVGLLLDGILEHTRTVTISDLTRSWRRTSGGNRKPGVWLRPWVAAAVR
jgi:hypothetical protein